MAYLHGIEHLNVASDFAPVNDVVTAVIGLIGTASGGESNKMILCSNEKDDAQFGNKGTIPEALRIIRTNGSSRGGALVICIKVASDTETPTPADFVGKVEEDGTRTGLKLFSEAITTFGFEPFIYIAPRFSSLAAIKTELISITEKTEAMAYIDTPDGYTYTQVLASRSGSGEFSMLTEGQKLLFPHALIANADSTSEEDKYINTPFSALSAGLRAKIDLEEGWHVSSSNHKYIGVEGLDVPITFSLGDLTCEANMLNAQGVTTCVNLNGFVEWGNYTAGYPGNTNTEAFECVRRTRAIMKRSIQQACIPYIDKPLIQANIDSIRNTVNQYLNSLQSQSKIVYGKCFYRASSNPESELAQGHVTFDIEFTPALPMQRLTFTYKIDLSQLANIV